MTDWNKHKFGPGYDTCAKCLGPKQVARRGSKWCAACDADAKKRRADGALDRPDTGRRVVRRSRIIK